MSYGRHAYGRAIVAFRHKDAELRVGNFCSIAAGTTVYLGGNHRTDWVTTYPFGHMHKKTFSNFDGTGHPATKGDIVIGNDVWIGAHATIMSGVTIGDGVVVAANSHVVKDARPYTIVGGNPAREIKQRFTDEQIRQLLKIRWWEWDDETIDCFTPQLCHSDIDMFIRDAQAAKAKGLIVKAKKSMFCDYSRSMGVGSRRK